MMGFWDWLKQEEDVLITLVILGIFLLGIHRHDCYYFHVLECEECHKRGLGFAICSGFCYNSTIDSDCFVKLEEDCKTNIPHGCNFIENEYIDGWCIPLTDWCYYIR